MAADILAYDIDYVPVGIDQKQHVELARDIAIRFNNKFGKTFTIPDVLISKSGTKIMDLLTPDKKMSKSNENQKGVIRLLDSPDIIRKKIMSATTDSEMNVKFDPENKPGISNLINIYISFTNKTITEVEKEFENSNYGDFKRAVANIVVENITKIQENYNKIINSDELDKILNDGIASARNLSKAKLDIMKEKMGFKR
jgi:tryptophanyl-tRNA synthetase